MRRSRTDLLPSMFLALGVAACEPTPPSPDANASDAGASDAPETASSEHTIGKRARMRAKSVDKPGRFVEQARRGGWPLRAAEGHR